MVSREFMRQAFLKRNILDDFSFNRYVLDQPSDSNPKFYFQDTILLKFIGRGMDNKNVLCFKYEI